MAVLGVQLIAFGAWGRREVEESCQLLLHCQERPREGAGAPTSASLTWGEVYILLVHLLPLEAVVKREKQTTVSRHEKCLCLD